MTTNATVREKEEEEEAEVGSTVGERRGAIAGGAMAMVAAAAKMRTMTRIAIGIAVEATPLASFISRFVDVDKGAIQRWSIQGACLFFFQLRVQILLVRAGDFPRYYCADVAPVCWYGAHRSCWLRPQPMRWRLCPSSVCGHRIDDVQEMALFCVSPFFQEI